MNDNQDTSRPIDARLRPAPAVSDAAGHAVDEPWASGQRKRYLASLDTRPEIL